MAKVTLQDRIKAIQGYFRGIEIKENLYIVKVEFPERWSAYPSEDGLINVARAETTYNDWFYYANVSEVELNDIFDLIDDTIVTNESINKKIELMKIKMEELKNLFQEETLERLLSLKFTFDEPKKRKKSGRKKKNNTENNTKEDKTNTPEIEEEISELEKEEETEL